MNQILALREKRAKAWNAAKAFLDSKRGTNGLVSAEDTAVYDRMEADVVALGQEIDRLERQAALDAELARPTSAPITNQPNGRTPQSGRASDAYKQAFWDSIRQRNFTDPQNSLSIGVDTEGGYLVPDEYERRLVSALQEENIFRRLATIIKTSSGDRKIPVVTGHGEATWMDENGAYTESDESFGQTTIGAYKLGTAIKISEELLNDSVFDLESYIATEFARRIGTKEEEAFLVGDGQSKPTGVLNSAEAGVTTAGTSISFDDVMDLYHALRSVYRSKAVWLLNDTTVKALRKLKDGNGNYIWQPSVQLGQPDMILNRPYYTSNFVPDLTAGNKVMAFGDFSYYWIADRQGRSFKRLNELYAANGQIGFLASQRVDGKLILPEAVKVMTLKA
ncbi:MAG: phage major capsid protein [Butyricicoccaceae bacterium]